MHADELKPTGTVTISTDEYNMHRDFMEQMRVQGHVVMCRSYGSPDIYFIYKEPGGAFDLMERWQKDIVSREKRVDEKVASLREWSKLPFYKRLFNIPSFSQYL